MADKKKMTPLERRQKDIDNRAARVAALAKKKGMTVEQLRKQERDTFINVVGGAASLLPIGAIVRGANALLKGAKAAKTASKASKAVKSASKTSGTSVTKAPGTAVKPKGTSVSSRTGSGSGKKSTSVGPARPAMKNVTPKAKPTKATPKSKIVGLSNKGKVAAGVAAGLGAAALLASGKDKGKASASTTKPSVSSPTSRPDRRKGKPDGEVIYKRKQRPGSYDEEKKQNKKGPGVGKQDKADPRKNFKSTPVKNAALPAGAKPFKGSYNSKTHKLKNIRGKTYVVKK